MYMSGLKLLHKSMLSLSVDVQQFQVDLGIASFDCLFSTRESPYILALTSRGACPKFFKFEVKQGYWIKEYFGDIYGDLLEVLWGNKGSGNRLLPKEFLEQLNEQVPDKASLQNICTSEIMRLRPDISEDRDRPYFDTWVRWKSGDRGPTKENKEKTLALIGKEALDYSIEMNASSKWSAKNLNRDWDAQV